MNLSVSQARRQLGQLVTLAQDPRVPIVLTRHGRPVAALVSVAEVNRIWRLQEEEWMGPKSILSGRARGALIARKSLIIGPGGKAITRSEAAEIVHQRQMTRAEERRVLSEGGLTPVDNGELAGTVTWRKRRWWQVWRRT